MIITRSKSHWEKPELWTHGYHSQQVVRFQGLTIDIIGTKYSYISIGKVASTFMTKFLEKLNYPEIIYDYNIEDEYRLPQTYIVVLRDPIERWCSGIVEYLVNNRKFRGNDSMTFNLKDRETLDLIFGYAIFDRHTCPQVDYLHNIDTDQCVFFKLDKDFENNIRRFTEKELNVPTNNVIISDNMYNTSERDTHKELREVINFEINDNPRYLEQIKSNFVDDIILYNSVNYYE
mgnify:FL=1